MVVKTKSADAICVLQGISGEKNYTACVDINPSLVSNENSALQYLWARHRIMLLDDYNHLGINEQFVKEVTQLGLDYNLLTAYTSFLAIDSIKSGDGAFVTVKQPLPLPQGVSDFAVGNSSSNSAYGGLHYNSSPAQVFDKTKYSVVKEEADQEAIFTITETMPEFPGGDQALKQYLQKNIMYPAAAAAQKIEGVVFIKMTIDENGNITKAEVAKGVSKELDAEALRVIKNMPRWNAGTQSGIPVKMQMTLPVKFRLS